MNIENSHSVLFVTEKWYAGNPDFSFTNNFHNLFNTFNYSYGDKFKWNTIHIDESHLIYGRSINDILINYCLRYKIKLIIFSLLGDDPRNPIQNTLEILKNLGIKLCFMWPDTAEWTFKKISSLENIADLHVSWDNSSLSTTYSKNHLSLWVPQDKYLFFPDQKEFNVSFIGGKHHQDRQYYLSELYKKIPDLIVSGGQNESKLTPQKYAYYIRKSKINLNFSHHPLGFDQIKGRVYEVIASKSLLLEKKNDLTNKILIPNIHYIEFESIEDCLYKINYYLKNQEEANNISENAYQLYREKYTAEKFWEIIMNALNFL